MMLGLSLGPCALRPTAFALVLPGGGSRCASRICCHLLGTECERRRREHSSRKNLAIPAIKHYLRGRAIVLLRGGEHCQAGTMGGILERRSKGISQSDIHQRRRNILICSCLVMLSPSRRS